jgi:hypothetical protein
MGRTFSINRGKCILDVGGKARRKETTRKTYKWMDNIKIVLRKMEWSGMDLIDLAQNRDKWVVLVNTLPNLRIS